ncbi:MAG: 1-deoxy-D-xylulose-5-phosphate reductoisomerase [Phycisphaerales bacterium]|nr:1-deoxy-D-xylulose-5-phosphate reductoisomerase [Phycisphaerales bacterium]
MRLLVLGSTGSIGTQTLDVVSSLRRAGRDIEVVGLCAGRNASLLAQQAERFPGARLALTDGGLEGAITGADAATRLVHEVDCDVVMGAIVGFAGLDAIMAAIERGCDIALANKETLVAAGTVVVPAARRRGVRLLPVDSEHSGLWQCLPDIVPPVTLGPGISRLILTASGGPFRTATLDAMSKATVAEALAHPTWSMGPKVTIDSATLTNKALEIMEAHWLFGVESSRIEAIVHPQSIIHAMVEMADGSIVAQMGTPDMRTPIQVALTWPERTSCPSPTLDLGSLSRLDFEPPDPVRFPALEIVRDVMDAGGSAGAIFNASNEAGVEAFLEGRIGLLRIGDLVREALASLGSHPVGSLDDVRDADEAARAFVRERVG